MDIDQARSRQGYIVLALGPSKYLDMAINLAASIKVMDPTRRICLVHDGNVTADTAQLRYFDDTAIMPLDPDYPGFMCKIRVFDASPYEETMFVDADCLMVKTDIDRYWQSACTRFFSITGGPRTSGEWKGADIATLLSQEGAPYLIQMNSGVFYFDKSPESKAFFGGLNAYYMARRHLLGVGLHRGKPAQTDEIYIGLYMGLSGMGAANMARVDQNSWMVSTWRGIMIRFDAGRSVIYKPRGNPLNPFAGWDRLSPTFAHFVSLKPHRLYWRLSRQFRALADRAAC
jgi:hypothetical protein